MQGCTASLWASVQPPATPAPHTLPPPSLPPGGREPWDLARFGRTVAFFNDDLSSPGRVLQTLLTAPVKALVNLVAGSEAPVRDFSLLLGVTAGRKHSTQSAAACGAEAGVGREGFCRHVLQPRWRQSSMQGKTLGLCSFLQTNSNRVHGIYRHVCG